MRLQVVLKKARIEDGYPSRRSSITLITIATTASSVRTLTGTCANFYVWASEANIKSKIEEYALKDANRAFLDLKQKHIRGVKVLNIESSS